MRFTFSHRLSISFLILTLLLVAVGYFAFVTTRGVQRVSTAIMKENVSSLKAAEELELALLNQKGFVASYFLDGNIAWLNTLEQRKKDFDFWFNKARESALTDNEKRILRDIAAQYKIYDRQRNRAIALYQAGNIQEAKGLLLGDLRNIVDALYQKCEDLIFANEALIAGAESASRGNVVRMTIFLWLMIATTLIFGAVTGFFIARKVNEQLVRAAKLASLGQVSANVAHEIRNPLTSIKMRLYSLQDEIKRNPEASEDFQVINEEIDRMEKTVKNFLDFARLPEPNLENGDILQILDGTLRLLSSKARAQKIHILENKHQISSLEATIDKEQIRQVFLNIMLNAIEAMPDSGTLEVSTTLSGKRASKKYIDIRIKDTGSGITVEAQKKLTEPFFTTKTEGTGLGLFIASKIIRIHKGSLEINSVPGQGTTVIVRIPIA